MYYIRHAVIIS